jgi:carboxymethylenebutenolidase
MLHRLALTFVLIASLAVAQDFAKKRLESSPRHGEWVQVNGSRTVQAFGYIAIAPDRLSGYGPNGGKTSDFASPVDARDAIGKLNPDGVTSDLNAIADFAKKIPAANGKIAFAGFCWGRSNSFRFSTNLADISAAFVFYGGPPDKDAIARIIARITQENMKAAGKTYDSVAYDGAGHGFMRAGEDPEGNEPNRKPRNDAWARWKTLLAKL